MKTIFALLVLFSGFASAQESRTGLSEGSSRHEIGVHVTPTLGWSQMALKWNGGGFDSDSGVAAGGLVEIGSGQGGFQTGLMYHQFGGKRAQNGGVLHVNLDYVAVPLLGKVNFFGSATHTVYLRGGVMPEFLVGKKSKFIRGNLTRTSDNVGIKNFDLAVMGGIGGAIPVTDELSLSLGLDYVRSLLSINSSSGNELRNEGFVLNAGAIFAL